MLAKGVTHLFGPKFTEFLSYLQKINDQDSKMHKIKRLARRYRLMSGFSSHGRICMIRKVHKKKLVFGIIVGLVSLFGSSMASAQAIQPMRPTDQRALNQPRLSPYLNLLREDNSTLSPYHSFVRPQRENYQRQSQQSSELRHLETRVLPRQQGRIAGSPISRLPTGNGAKFQAYSHFYQFEPIRP